MSQKANLLTLRKKNRIELVVYNSKIWSSLYILVENITRIFFLKGIWTLKNFFSFDTNLVFVNFSLYYQNSKIAVYKRKMKLKKKFLITSVKDKSFSTVLKQCINKLGYNVFNIKIKNLNLLIDKQKLPFLFKELKIFSFTIFSRRFNLFLDFLKITILFYDNHIDLSNYIKIWARIFQHLSKRIHSKFFLFVKTVIKSLIKMNILFDMGCNSICKTRYTLCGVKFLLSGRIRGKSRASSNLIQIGNIPIQTISKPINFATSHVYTLYGVFGIKIWTYFKKS